MGIPVEEARATFTTWPPSDRAQILRSLDRLGVRNVAHIIRPASFARYVLGAGYPESYASDFGPLFVEKALEHWVSLQLLAGVRSYDVGVDVAACTSPYYGIQWRLAGVPTYRQDIGYTAEDGEPMKIGGTAEHLPFGDGALARLTLHCSFEHFEGEADSGLILEAARVLRPGGRLCILPLYMSEVFHNVTDPEVDRAGLVCDEGAAIAEVRGWRNRFGRWYDTEQLQRRVLAHAGDFDVTLVHVVNARDIDAVCYLDLALLLTRKGR